MKLQHSNIIALYAAFQDDEGFYLVQVKLLRVHF